MEYYGGISNYIGTNSENDLYTKFVTYNTKDIRIGMDESVDENTATQLKHCVDYLNKMFDVINPNYHFNLVRADKNNCDIFVNVYDLEQDPNAMKETYMAITTNVLQKNSFSKYQKGSGDISFNRFFLLRNETTRYVFLHELMHVLLDNYDLSSDEEAKYNHDSVPFSVLSYNHSSTMTYPELYIKGDKKKNMDYYKDEFVIYPPFDIAAYAARYGNFKNENNKKACTQLIVDTYEMCKEVFGANRKYFREDMQLNSEGYPVQFEKYVNNKKEFNITNNNNILFDYEREF